MERAPPNSPRDPAARLRRSPPPLLDCLSAVLMLSLTAVVLAEVLARNLLNVSIHWTTDVSIILLQYVVFFGGFLASLVGGHLRVDLVSEQLPAGPKRVLDMLARLVGLCFLAVAVYSGWLLLPYMHGARVPTLPVRQSYVVGALVALLALMLLAEAFWLARLARRR